jgi:hypothetical protein
MNGRTIARLLPLACVVLALAVTQPLDAQFGGLGRRITEGVKKATGGDADETAKPGKGKPVVLPTNDPHVIPITDKVLDGYARALQTEIDLRNQLRNELIAREQEEKKYAACKQQAASSPEAVQIMMQLGSAGDSPTTEQMMALMKKMEADQAALVLKMCGADPPAIDVAQRLTQIREKAAASAGAIS